MRIATVTQRVNSPEQATWRPHGPPTTSANTEVGVLPGPRGAAPAPGLPVCGLGFGVRGLRSQVLRRPASVPVPGLPFPAVGPWSRGPLRRRAATVPGFLPSCSRLSCADPPPPRWCRVHPPRHPIRGRAVRSREECRAVRAPRPGAVTETSPTRAFRARCRGNASSTPRGDAHDSHRRAHTSRDAAPAHRHGPSGGPVVRGPAWPPARPAATPSAAPAAPPGRAPRPYEGGAARPRGGLTGAADRPTPPWVRRTHSATDTPRSVRDTSPGRPRRRLAPSWTPGTAWPSRARAPPGRRGPGHRLAVPSPRTGTAYRHRGAAPCPGAPRPTPPAGAMCAGPALAAQAGPSIKCDLSPAAPRCRSRCGPAPPVAASAPETTTPPNPAARRRRDSR